MKMENYNNKLLEFTAYDMALLYNPKLLIKSVDFVRSQGFDNKADIIGSVLKQYLFDPGRAENLSPHSKEMFYETVPCRCYYNNNRDIYYGYTPELLDRKIVHKSDLIENYLCSVGVRKNLIDMRKLQGDNYCEDAYGWIYIPVPDIPDVSNVTSIKKSTGLLSKAESVCSNMESDNITNPCSASTDILERNLDICHSLAVVHRMQELIFSSCEIIVEKLNKLSIFKDRIIFSEGSDYFVNDIKCGKYIEMRETDSVINDIKEEKRILFYGICPDIFNLEIPLVFKYGKYGSESKVIADYFSSVVVNRDYLNLESKSNLVKNGMYLGNKNYYFPICRKLLCCDNVAELYVKRVVDIIKEGFKL